MTASFNRAQLLGNLGRDAQQKGNGGPLVFDLATSELIGHRMKTTWHKVVLMEPWLVRLSALREGDLVLVEGKMRHRRVSDENGGHNVTEVVVDEDGKIMVLNQAPR